MKTTQSAQPSTASKPDSAPAAWRVEVHRLRAGDDPEGLHALAALREAGWQGLRSVRTARGFLLPAECTRALVDAATREILADPVLDRAVVCAPRETPPPAAGVLRVLVARKSGVMDPVARTVARAMARSRIWQGEGEPHTTTFRVFLIEGEPAALDPALAREYCTRVLGNETIEDVLVASEALPWALPRQSPRHGVVHVPLRGLSDEELAKTSREGSLSLNLVEMRAVQAHYEAQRRDPTIAELETIAQTWSEHCKHKTFTSRVEFEGRVIDNLLKQTIKAATMELAKPWCVSVFHDNAGIIEFDQGFDVCMKVETHNHPSAIDPYGGAGTGVGGVIRDILGVGLGAKPIANTDAFFVGPLDLPQAELPKGCMHPRRILSGVVAGVRDYGNRMGIPTVAGGVWSHPDYVGNPLVYAGTVGIMPHWAATKSVQPGDRIVVVGGRTGRDGIHGATFSSVELTETSEIESSAAVQIGDAITEKRVLDLIVRARDARLYRGITDCGAGGLSSAVGEMGAECGAAVRLESVPLKYPGLSPEEIWISEAQERMVLAVPPESLEGLLAACREEDVEATVIGEFTSTGRLVLTWHGEVQADLDLHFLHEGTPKPVRKARFEPPREPDSGVPAVADHHALLLALLSSTDIASKEWIVRQYDHEVQGQSVLKPMTGVKRDAPSDAAVIKPLSSSRKGLAIGCGASPRYGRLDPGAMAETVIDEALRNVVAVGGDPDRTAILDNFSWGNCAHEDRMGSLVLASEGCYRAAKAYGTPFISGKDSLNNEFKVGDRVIAIPPTLLVSALSIVPDVEIVVASDWCCAGSLLYLVGSTRPHFGGSHHHLVRGLSGGAVPRPDLAEAPRVLRAMHAAIKAGCVRSCHDLSEGGLAVAAAESAFGGCLGATIELAKAPCDLGSAARVDRDAALLYSETPTRFLVEVDPARAAEFERQLAGLPHAQVGSTRAEGVLEFTGASGASIARWDIEDLRRAHQSGWKA
jgi:phosphoribosylformylglycinamidine synthase